MSIVKHIRDRDTALTSAELCKLINLHPVTLREWNSRRTHPGVSDGPGVAVRPNKVADWLDEREVGIP